jgi:hypothetical protein
VSSNTVDIKIGYVFDINLDFYSYPYSNLFGSMLVNEVREREVLYLFTVYYSDGVIISDNTASSDETISDINYVEGSGHGLI